MSEQCPYTGSEITLAYTVTAADGTVLEKGTDYTETFAPATVQEMGDYTLTITANSPYSGSQSFNFTVMDANMPKTGTKTINIPAGVQSFKVYDDGGKDGDYSLNCNGYLVLTAPEGYVLQLSGNIQTDGNWGDWFWAYNGTKTSDPMLLSANKSPDGGTQTTINTVTSTGQSMMLRFDSNSGGTAAGLDLTVTVVNANTEYNVTVSNPDTGGTVSSNKTKAKVNDTITLTATPANGYILSDLNVTNANDYAMNVAWDIWSNTATFTMIGSDITVTPTFTDKLTADDGLSINMPVNGTKTVSIPASVQSFKVYDDGGKDGIYYSGRNTSILVLTAPEGRVLKLSGSIMTRQYDNLTVYDNNAASGDKLIDDFGSLVYKAYNPIPTVCSTGQSMTIYFYGQNQYSNLDGFDLTVTVIDPNTEYDITVNNPTTGGIVACDKDKAKLKETVTVTATPASGYILGALSVTDANNEAVEVTWDIWSNTATFAMPASAVTVTPTFINDVTNLSINMPKTGTKSALIPAIAHTIKVYDDGGPTGRYSDGCRSYLVLKAPANYLLQLSGNITTETYDNLTVYDGSDNSAITLLDGVSSSSDDTQTAITTVTSSGQSMMLYFKSDNSTHYAGLDLTVTLVSPSVTEGDANGDGQVTITDAVAIVNYILGNASANFNLFAADVNRDGNITITDAVGVVNIILNSGGSSAPQLDMTEPESMVEPE